MCDIEQSRWTSVLETPKHMKTVVGFYPEYDVDDCYRFQFVYFDERDQQWHEMLHGLVIAAPEQWTVITDPSCPNQFDADHYEIGEWVQWRDVRARGGRIQALNREGRIVAINGRKSTVRLRNGRTTEVYLTHLIRDGDAESLAARVTQLRAQH